MVAASDGETVTAEAGALLLEQTDLGDPADGGQAGSAARGLRALAGKSMLNRLELRQPTPTRCCLPDLRGHPPQDG
jgi:hypothetical protein